MNYLATGINESPVITQPAATAITDVRGHAVKFNSSGAVILAVAGILLYTGDWNGSMRVRARF